MIDLKDPRIQQLLRKGYRVSVHGYADGHGRVKYSYLACTPAGRAAQGWGRGPEAALADLFRRLGLDDLLGRL